MINFLTLQDELKKSDFENCLNRYKITDFFS